MTFRRLVLFVEGPGDSKAVPTLAERVVAETNGLETIFVDRDTFQVRSLGNLLKVPSGKTDTNWCRLLKAAGKRKNVAAVLLVLDGDLHTIPHTWTAYREEFGTDKFCPFRAASVLIDAAKLIGAGSTFSLAVVFAMKEFEAWLLAGLSSPQEVDVIDERRIVQATPTPPVPELEQIRDAKGWLCRVVPGYSESLDQHRLAQKVELQNLRRLRSFRRFESAVQQMVEAAQRGRPVATPQRS